jgi:hypothetical protein
LKCWWLGVFIAPTTKVAVGEGCCRRAHRTVRCASHVTQPLGFDRWSFWHVGHRTVRWCTGYVMFTVWCTIWRLLWLCTRSRHCSLFTFAVDRWRCSRYSAGTPDSPVLHRTVRWIIAESHFQKPEAEQFEWIHPGAPDTVRWHTGQSGAPDQGCLRCLLLLFIWTLSWTFYWFVLNLWHL